MKNSIFKVESPLHTNSFHACLVVHLLIWSHFSQWTPLFYCLVFYNFPFLMLVCTLLWKKKKLKLKKQWQIFMRNFLVSILCENEMILETYPPGHRIQVTTWTSSERLMYVQRTSFFKGASVLFFYLKFSGDNWLFKNFLYPYS